MNLYNSGSNNFFINFNIYRFDGNKINKFNNIFKYNRYIKNFIFTLI